MGNLATPRKPDTLIINVFMFKQNKDEYVRKKVINIIPQLATAFGREFTHPSPFTNPHNILHYSINYLIDLIKLKQHVVDDQERPIAYISLGKLVTAMSSSFRTSPAITEIISTIKQGFTQVRSLEIFLRYGYISIS
jgi:hypothetical protein